MVHVVAPCRLHFGLLSFGNPDRRQFGGVGAMVEDPQVVVRFSPAPRFVARGPFAERIGVFVSSWTKWHRLALEPACAIEVVAAPRSHVGLGVGTQLGLSVAAGLNALAGKPSGTGAELAASVGRGLRSAVGTFGFLRGGLIVEAGKLPDETLSPLMSHAPIPAAWRFVVITPSERLGLWGKREQQAFRQLPPVPAEVTEELIREVEQSMLPAVRRENFEGFSESIYRYGFVAGNCFAAVQGGPYNGRALQALVDRLTATGFRGVGQSSWGPTVFVLTPTLPAAEGLVGRIRGWPELATADIVIAAANNRGASITLDDGECESH